MFTLLSLTFILSVFPSVFFSKALPIHINPETRQFTDSLGRERFFHGVNLVKKSHPYYPNAEMGWSGRENIEELKRIGFNLIRLGVMWAGVQPEFGGLNKTYLLTMRKLINDFGDEDIYVLVDAHQDFFSESYCGDGSPRINYSTHDISRFPRPYPGKMVIDPKTGFPDKKSCSTSFKERFYLSYDVQRSFENLYFNKDPHLPVRDHFLSYWEAMIKTFRDIDSVLGYDIINEPFPANVHKNPFLLVPDFANMNLLKFYNYIIPRLRKFDNRHIMFAEPVTWYTPTAGFKGVPGGYAYRNLTGLSYHFYRPINSGPQKTLKFWYDVCERLKIGRLLSEFWSYAEISNQEELFSTLEMADKLLTSWTSWHYFPIHKKVVEAKKPTSTISMADTVRTYPFAVAGRTIGFSFDRNSFEFRLTFSTTDKCNSNETLIYFSSEMHYTNGITANVASNGPSCKVEFAKTYNLLTVTHDKANCKEGDQITVIISKL